MMEGSFIQDKNVYLTEVSRENDEEPKGSLNSSLAQSTLGS